MHISNTKKSTISPRTSSYANFVINLKVNSKEKLNPHFDQLLKERIIVKLTSWNLYFMSYD